MNQQADIIPGEEWRDVPGWERYYQVSSEGRLRRLPRRVKSRWPSGRWHSGGIIGIPSRGYRDVKLTADGRVSRKNLHVLVCEAFHGPKPFAGAEVCHGDGDRENNRPDNLRWGSAAENAADRALHGSNLDGEKHPGSKLTASDICRIRDCYEPGYGNLTKIAREYGVSATLILNIVRRKTWKHIP